ncbi:MAG: T9SS type A sorting domain-containing protein [Spirochaetes bacterium]|nr:T9SS type A sorting domain-containing protein [Spirochaetota bacterium]
MKIIILFLMLLLSGRQGFGYPLSGGDKSIVQDVKASGGGRRKSSSSFVLADNVVGQPGIIGFSSHSGEDLSHGYLGAGKEGQPVFYIKSIILYPEHLTFINRVGVIEGRAQSPVSLNPEKICLVRLSDNKYFNGIDWTSQEVWLTCQGGADWFYEVRDRDVFEYGNQYKISAMAVDVTEAFESDYPSVNFTYVFSTDFKQSLAAYPNPFFPTYGNTAGNTVTIEYFLQQSVETRIYIYAINGELVREWKGEEYNTIGLHRFQWDGKNKHNVIVGSGIYMLVVKSGSKNSMDKIAIIR